MFYNQCGNTLVKKSPAIIFIIVMVLSVALTGTLVTSAQTQQVTEQNMTFDIGGGKERTGLYTGPLENNLPHGRGRFEWTFDGSRCVYEGDFSGGVLKGQGIMTIKTNRGEWIYTGAFYDGDPQGEFERVGGDGVISLVRTGGFLGLALWIVIAIMLFFVMVLVISLRELIKRYLFYRKARQTGTWTLETSFWKTPGAAFLNPPDTPFIVGVKPVFNQICGIVAIIISLDLWWLICYGFDWFFCILLSSTIVNIVKTVIELRKNISVEDDFVKIDGIAVAYDSIVYVGVTKKSRIVIKTAYGQKHELPLINAQAVSDAIMANKAKTVGV